MKSSSSMGNIMEKIKLADYGYSILQIETRLTCNMKCKFCACPIIKNKGDILPDRTVFDAIDSLDPYDEKFEYICFNQYNEPLLDKRIFKFIKYAKDNKFKVLIITNGLLLRSKKIREKLIEADPTYIKISLQTLNEHLFRKSRGVKTSFNEYKKGIFEFSMLSSRRDSSPKIVIDLACNFLSRRQLILKKLLGLEHGDPSVPNTLDELEPDFINFLIELHNHFPTFEYNESNIGGYLDTLENNYLNQEEFTITDNISIKVKKFIYGRRLSKFYPTRTGSGCGTRIIGVLANGSVVPCCLAYEDMLSMGNIKNESLKSILEKNRNFLDGIKKGTHLPETCKICHGAPTIRGTMFADILKKFIRS